MVASGNDFVVFTACKDMKTAGYKQLASRLCDRKYGIGADGLLVLEKSSRANMRMRIFNADGSEAEMCGNGARCAALYAKLEGSRAVKSRINIETKAGIIESEVDKDNVRIKLTTPKSLRLDIPLKINNRILKVNFINTGVPHVVIFSSGLSKIDIAPLGRIIRNHKYFSPRGANVNFVEVKGEGIISVRTYERGVEDETLACGTGSVASSLIFSLKSGCSSAVTVITSGGEMLKVYFERMRDKFDNVWLEGRARVVFRGVFSY